VSAGATAIHQRGGGPAMPAAVKLPAAATEGALVFPVPLAQGDGLVQLGTQQVFGFTRGQVQDVHVVAESPGLPMPSIR
jgi:hypothetical protein